MCVLNIGESGASPSDTYTQFLEPITPGSNHKIWKQYSSGWGQRDVFGYRELSTPWDNCIGMGSVVQWNAVWYAVKTDKVPILQEVS